MNSCPNRPATHGERSTAELVEALATSPTTDAAAESLGLESGSSFCQHLRRRGLGLVVLGRPRGRVMNVTGCKALVVKSADW